MVCMYSLRSEWHGRLAGCHKMENTRREWSTSGLISMTLRPRVALRSLCADKTVCTTSIKSSNTSASQFLKCTETQNLLCSTLAPFMSSTLQTGIELTLGIREVTDYENSPQAFTWGPRLPQRPLKSAFLWPQQEAGGTYPTFY